MYRNVSYYMDRSVLLENTPLVKFIQNYIQHILHILTSEDVDDVISRSFAAVRCKQSVKNGEKYLYNKKKITRWLEDMNFKILSLPQENKIHSSRRHVISSIYFASRNS